MEEKFELVASGRGIAMVPRSVARSYARHGLVHRPVTGADVLEIYLAATDDRRQQHLNDFLSVAAAALLGRHS